MTEEQPKEVPPQEAQAPAQDAQAPEQKQRGRGNKRGFGRGEEDKREVQEDKRKKNGYHAPTLEDLSNQSMLNHWKKSTTTQSQSRNGKLSISYIRNHPMPLKKSA